MATSITLRSVKGSALTHAEVDDNFSNLKATADAALPSATAATTYQPLDGDLTSIAGLSGTSGFLKKTAANTWSLDTSTYLDATTAASTYQTQSGMSSYLTTSSASSTYQTLSGMTSYLLSSTATSTYVALAGSTMTGNLTFSGNSRKIIGDFSNATVANRMAFQTSTSNGATIPYIVPNGTGNTAGIAAANASDPTNSSIIRVSVNGTTDTRINSDINGTGSYLPLTIYTGGSERMRVGTDGATVIAANSSSDGLRITQEGSGNALVVEDSANPDSTPFVVNNDGRTIIGTTASFSDRNSLLQIAGANSSAGFTTARWNSTDGTLCDFTSNPNATIGSYTVPSTGQELVRLRFTGWDGTQQLVAAQISSNIDATPGTNDMPGRLVFSTTADGASSPTERMRIDNAGSVGIGSTSIAGYGLRVAKTSDAASFVGIGSTNSDTVAASTASYRFYSVAATSANSGTIYTIPRIDHFNATQGTFNADSRVTNQYGFIANNTLTGATNNFGFYSGINTGTSRTITNVDRTSNVVTITTSVAHGYTAGQSVTVAATTNTGLNGTFTIASVPTTTTFTYAQTGTDIASVADTGTTVVVGRWNFYANGSAPNYFAGNVGVGASSPAQKLQVNGSVYLSGGTGTAVSFSSDLSSHYLKYDTTLNGVKLNGYAAVVFETVSSERMRIDSSGNVGIGTSSAGDKLTVTSGNVRVDNGNNGSIGFWSGAAYFGKVGVSGGVVSDTSNDIAVQADTNRGIRFYTNGSTERMRIDANGFASITGSFGRGAPVTKTASFTLAATENWIICNGSGSITVTLPAASSWTGRELTIKTIAAQTVVSASSNVVPIGTATAGTAILPATAGSWATLVSDGTNWVIMQS